MRLGILCGIGGCEDDVWHQCSFAMCFVVVCAHFWREIAPVSIENRVILRGVRRDFGAADARIDRKTCEIIVKGR